MSNKKRIVYLQELLKENTNLTHHIKTEDIIQMMSEQGYEVERKTIYNDVKQLNDMGYVIEKAHDGYYFNNELFDIAELRVLVDSVKASAFLSEKKTISMNEKLLSLTNKYDRDLLNDGQFEGNKTNNEQILYNIDAIMRAIQDHRVVKFKMFDYTIDGIKKYRPHNYDVFPHALVVNDGRYYLVGISVKYNEPSTYRLDRIEGVTNSSKKYENADKTFDVKEYMNTTFAMYTGKKINVTLWAENKIYDEIIKKFGEELIIKDKTKDSFTFNVNASVTPTFFSWLFTFGKQIKLIGPEEIMNEYIKRCEEQLAQYRK